MIFKKQSKVDDNSNILMPPGIPYIIGNELAERFSYYGMRSILIVFMTQYLLNSDNTPQFTNLQATFWYHIFDSACYLFPILGSFIADIFWGKYKTIIFLSIVYCLGYLILAFFNSKIGLFSGLILVAIGTGGIKSCIGSHVGDQFNRKSQILINRVYSWFLSVIVTGASLGMLYIPYLLKKYGSGIAFSASAFSMLIATAIFYQGKKNFIIVPPVGWRRYKKEIQDPLNKKAMINIIILFAFMSVFFTLMGQIGSSWVIQAGKMNRNISLGFIKFTFEQSQVQFFVMFFVIIFAPIFSHVIYPFLGRFIKITYLKKIAAGFFLGGASFAVIAISEMWLEQGIEVSISWQILASIILAIAAILIYVTGDEISYTHAPNSIKSLFVAFYCLSICLGNILTAMFNLIIQDENGHSIISGSTYFWCFVGLMLVVGIAFIFYMPYYKGKVHLQKIKTSLPARSIEHYAKIKQINDIILKIAKKKIAFIILFGAIVRRGQDSNDKQISSEYINNYHFLIVTKHKKDANLEISNKLEDEIIKRLNEVTNIDAIKSSQLKTQPTTNNKTTITVESIDQFNIRSEERKLFKEGVLLYDANTIRLSEPKQMTKDKRRQIAKESYQHWYNQGLDFLTIYENNKVKINNNRLLVFFLHQAAESFYACSLLVLTGEKPHSHELKWLNYLLCKESREFYNIFPTATKEQKECFELLEEGYVKSRYDQYYLISDQQLQYLFEKIKNLQEITQEICTKEIDLLENSI
jgi:POT family proton-dependent oligopeptide transporter